MRKVYVRLLPFAMLSYVLAYIDRINVSFAALHMSDDLHMSAGDFGFAVGTFYWAYFLFEVPSNVIMEKVGARIWIARIMITWGILAGLTALTYPLPNSLDETPTLPPANPFPADLYQHDRRCPR